MTPKWFAWINPLLALLFVLSWIPLAFIYYARTTNSPVPRISIIPDMDAQQRFKAQQVNPLYTDGRAMRPPVFGAVANGMEQADDHYYRGISGGQWATTFPKQVAINDELLKRGQERYTIYCSACHGLGGDGDGMVSKRAEELAEGTWIPPVSYQSDTVRNRPVGHIFNTITNGIRTMPAYGTQIPPEDRWAIVAYVRALQRSRNATLQDVPAEQRATLEAQAAAEAPAPAASAVSPGAATPPTSGTKIETPSQNGSMAAKDKAADKPKGGK